jgi:hypothetical protein
MTTIPDNTASITPGLHKQIRLDMLNFVLLISSAATLLPPLHCVGGIVLLVGCGVHVALHGHWIKAVILGTPKNITPAHRRQRRLFWAKLLSGLVCGLSELVTGLDTPPLALELHFFLPLHCCESPLHVVSGLAFGSLNIYHLVLHRNWFSKKLAFFDTASR